MSKNSKLPAGTKGNGKVVAPVVVTPPAAAIGTPADTAPADTAPADTTPPDTAPDSDTPNNTAADTDTGCYVPPAGVEPAKRGAGRVKGDVFVGDLDLANLVNLQGLFAAKKAREATGEVLPDGDKITVEEQSAHALLTLIGNIPYAVCEQVAVDAKTKRARLMELSDEDIVNPEKVEACGFDSIGETLKIKEWPAKLGKLTGMKRAFIKDYYIQRIKTAEALWNLFVE